MEKLATLSEKDTQSRAITISKHLLESQRSSQQESLKAMKDPNSLLRKAVEKLKQKNLERGTPIVKI